MIKKIIVVLSVLLLAVPAFAKWVPLPPPAGYPSFSENLNAVYFTSTTEGMFVGAAGSVLRTLSGGLAFSLTSEGSANFNDIIFPTSSEGYILGNAGSLWKTTDGGATFNLMSVSVEVASADFFKAAFNGNNRVFAAYDTAEAKSFLFSSADSGANFSASLATSTPGYEIRGVVSTGTINLIWGYDPANKNSIMKNGETVVWSSPTQVINDIYFVNSFTGYAVGSGGLIMKINIDTSGNVSYSTLNSGTAEPLNAVSFISTTYGWVVGEGGTILFTTNEGASFIPYVDPTLETSLRDVFALLEASTATLERPVVHAFIAGGNGKSYKLSSPTVTTVTPASAMQGWVGYVTVEGTGFMDRAGVQFSGTQIQVVSTGFNSESKVQSVAVISPATTVGTRDVAVENMDKTYGIKAGSFTVTANPNLVTIDRVWFVSNLYQIVPPDIPTFEISPSPTISFEVKTLSAGIITSESLNAKVLVSDQLSGIYNQVFFIPTSGITMNYVTADQKWATVKFTVPGIIPAGKILLEVYSEDSLGNVARWGGSMEVVVAFNDPGGGTTDITAAYSEHVVRTTRSSRVTLQLLPRGVYYRDGLTVYLFGPDGRSLGTKRVPPVATLAAAAAGSTGGGKINVELDTRNFGGGMLPTGMVIVKLMDNSTGRMLKTNLPPLTIINY